MRRRTEVRKIAYGAAVALIFAAAPLAAVDVQRDVILRAQSYIGLSYCNGGIAPSCFDCSGLVLNVYRPLVDGLPRISRDMARVGRQVQRDELLPGDLVFFATGPTAGAVTHVAIYIGQGSILHAISDGPNRGVAVTELNANYWRTRYHSARRVLPLDAPAPAATPAPTPTPGARPTTPTTAPPPAVAATRTIEPIQFARGRYSGELLNGEPHGSGRMEFNNGDRYEGQFARGAFEGAGTYRWANGAVYEGQFSNDMINGRGRLTAPRAATVAGLWRNGELVEPDAATGRASLPDTRAPLPYTVVKDSPWERYNGYVMGDFYAWQQAEREAFEQWRRDNEGRR